MIFARPHQNRFAICTLACGAVAACASAALAGSLPPGFNLTCEVVGTGSVWSATNNPGLFSAKFTPAGGFV